MDSKDLVKLYSDLHTRVADKKVLVVGDVVLDRTYWCRRANGGEHQAQANEIIWETSNRPNEDPGGAAQVACFLRRFVSKTTLVGLVGDDPESSVLTAAIAREHVQNGLVRTLNRPTTTKTRGYAPDPERNVIPGSLAAHRNIGCRFDYEDRTPVSDEIQKQLVSQIKNCGDEADAIVLLDLDKGVLTAPVIDAIGKYSSEKLLIVDPKRNWQKYSMLPCITALTPERRRAMEETLLPPDSPDERSMVRYLLETYQNTAGILVTSGPRGAIAANRTKPGSAIINVKLIQPAREWPPIVSSVGCGDACTAMMCACLLANFDWDCATELACYTASLLALQTTIRRRFDASWLCERASGMSVTLTQLDPVTEKRVEDIDCYVTDLARRSTLFSKGLPARDGKLAAIAPRSPAVAFRAEFMRLLKQSLQVASAAVDRSGELLHDQVVIVSAESGSGKSHVIHMLIDQVLRENGCTISPPKIDWAATTLDEETISKALLTRVIWFDEAHKYLRKLKTPISDGQFYADNCAKATDIHGAVLILSGSGFAVGENVDQDVVDILNRSYRIDMPSLRQCWQDIPFLFATILKDIKPTITKVSIKRATLMALMYETYEEIGRQNCRGLREAALHVLSHCANNCREVLIDLNQIPGWLLKRPWAVSAEDDSIVCFDVENA